MVAAVRVRWRRRLRARLPRCRRRSVPSGGGGSRSGVGGGGGVGAAGDRRGVGGAGCRDRPVGGDRAGVPRGRHRGGVAPRLGARRVGRAGDRVRGACRPPRCTPSGGCAARCGWPADGPAGSDERDGAGWVARGDGASGRLDAYRAGGGRRGARARPRRRCAPPWSPPWQAHFEVEDATALRRRCRRVLTRISPDLLHQRAARARAECGLRRWVDEPGVDRWEGTFPSEDAAQAWAAIDALARQYVTDGTCATIEGARAKALTDLVAGNATIDTVLTLTVPATARPCSPATRPRPSRPLRARPSRRPLPTATTHPRRPTPSRRQAMRRRRPRPSRPRQQSGPRSRGDLVEVTGPGAGEPVLVSHRGSPTPTPHPRCRSHLPPGHRRPARPPPAARPPTPSAPSGQQPRTAAADVERSRGPGAGPGPGPTYRPRRWSAGPGPALPVPRLQRRRRVLRPRPRPALARRTHPRRQPALPVPTPPPDQTTTRLAPSPSPPTRVATWTDPTGRTRTTHPVDALTSTVLTAPSDRHRSPRPTAATADQAPAAPAPSSPTAHTATSSSTSNTTPPSHRPTTAPDRRDERGATTPRRAATRRPQRSWSTPTGDWPHRRRRDLGAGSRDRRPRPVSPTTDAAPGLHRDACAPSAQPDGRRDRPDSAG